MQIGGFACIFVEGSRRGRACVLGETVSPIALGPEVMGIESHGEYCSFFRAIPFFLLLGPSRLRQQGPVKHW
jgi:hypothetical protein